MKYWCWRSSKLFHPQETSSSSTALHLYSDCWSLLTVFLNPSRCSTSSLEVILCRFASFHSSMGAAVSTVLANVALDLFLKSLTLLSLVEWPGLLYSAAPAPGADDEDDTSTLWLLTRPVLDLWEDFGRGLDEADTTTFSLASQPFFEIWNKIYRLLKKIISTYFQANLRRPGSCSWWARPGRRRWRPLIARPGCQCRVARARGRTPSPRELSQP